MNPYRKTDQKKFERNVTSTNLSTRLRNRAKVIDHVGLGHANTGIADAKELVLLVGNDSDIELLLSI
jgi:hypothetical protein